VKYGCIVDQALFGKGLYIQAGREGDRLAKDPDRPKVLIEIVVNPAFEKAWDAMYHKHTAKVLRTKGLSRSKARRAAQEAIKGMRSYGSLRMRDITE